MPPIGSREAACYPVGASQVAMKTAGPPGAARLEDQRIEEDRRAQTRNGRREFDPDPTCPSCGLRIERPHGSDADCIAALRSEIAHYKTQR